MNCPHCDRDLEEPVELTTGLCTSDDCPRHDLPTALLVRQLPTYTTTVTFIVNGESRTLTFEAQARSEYAAEQMAAHGVKALHPECRITALTTTGA